MCLVLAVCRMEIFPAIFAAEKVGEAKGEYRSAR